MCRDWRPASLASNCLGEVGYLGSSQRWGGARSCYSLASRAMTLVKGLLLLLAINLGLTQKHLEAVPVQSDFDVHKVSVMARLTRCWDKDWVQGVLYPEAEV